MIATPETRQGVVLDLDAAVREKLEERATQITAAELIGIILLVRDFAPLMESRPCICFNDNMSVIAAVCNGAARAPDLSALVHLLQLQLTRKSIAP